MQEDAKTRPMSSFALSFCLRVSAGCTRVVSLPCPFGTHIWDSPEAPTSSCFILIQDVSAGLRYEIMQGEL